MALVITAVLAGAGIAIALRVRAIPASRVSNPFFAMFAAFEPPVLGLTLLVAIAGIIWLARRSGHAGDGHHPASDAAAELFARPLGWPTVVAIALAVGVFTWLGTTLVMHGYLLSGDEVSADFQAVIFANGLRKAPVPADWQPYVNALLPPYVKYEAATRSWYSSYLPGNAFIRSVFHRLGAPSVASPFLATVSVLCMPAVARRLFPHSASAPWLATGLLVTSSQFLLMSMTAYAMPAHLCLSLVWLWLYLRDGALEAATLPWVGAAALGLHNPFPHALFATPFLLRIARTRPVAYTAYVATVYLVGSAYWLAWFRDGRVAERDGGLLATFAAPGAYAFSLQVVNLDLLAAWSAPFLLPCAMVAALCWRRLTQPLRDIAAGVGLTLAFYCFFPYDQQMGWGYRYAHAVLGNLILLATAGALLLTTETRSLMLRRAAVALLGAAFLVQLPLRIQQAESFVRPFDATMQALRNRPGNAVVVPTRSLWMGSDFVRNDPFLRSRPVLLGEHALGARRGYPAAPPSAQTIEPSALEHYGLPVKAVDQPVTTRPQ